MKPGDRVRFNEYCSWPERVGCEGVIVEPRPDGVYPQPSPHEVLVFLDADPLARDETVDRWWTCCATKKSLDVIR